MYDNRNANSYGKANAQYHIDRRIFENAMKQIAIITGIFALLALPFIWIQCFG